MQTYKPVGKLVGRFYTAAGQPTKELQRIEQVHIPRFAAHMQPNKALDMDRVAAASEAATVTGLPGCLLCPVSLEFPSWQMVARSGTSNLIQPAASIMDKNTCVLLAQAGGEAAAKAADSQKAVNTECNLQWSKGGGEHSRYSHFAKRTHGCNAARRLSPLQSCCGCLRT